MAPSAPPAARTDHAVRRRRPVRRSALRRPAPGCRGAGRRFACARAGPRRQGGDHAAHRARVLCRLLRRAGRRLRAGSAVPAGAALAARRPSQAHRRHPAQCAGAGTGDGRARQAAGPPVALASRGPEDGQHRARPVAGRCRLGAARACGLRRRFPAIHLRQHRRPEGRDPDARQPAGQPARDVAGIAGEQRRHFRLVVAAVPRHGPDRRVPGRPLPGFSCGVDVATDVPRAARALAGGDPPAPRHGLGGAQLRLRAVRGQAHRRRTRRAGPVMLAAGVQWRRAGEPRHAGALRVAVRALRPQARGA